MNIRKLQQQAASSVDELLSISGDVDTYVIKAYGQAPQEMVAMQCRIQLERLKRLWRKLVEIREELDRAIEPDDSQDGICIMAAQKAGQVEVSGIPLSAEGPGMEQQSSIAVTEQLIAQNLLLIAQKEELLEGFLAHSDMVGMQQKCAKELQDTAEIIRLKEALRNNL